jgi:catechol 2,3-dioxygenase-like lactoylglutathione lyase family enzyme
VSTTRRPPIAANRRGHGAGKRGIVAATGTTSTTPTTGIAAAIAERVAVTIDELTVADAPEAWRDCGFEVVGDTCVVGDIRLRLAGPDTGRGLTGWTLRNKSNKSDDLDGLPTGRSERPPPPPDERPGHPNGIAAIDHVVAIAPDLDRTVATLEGAGLDLRRIREEPTPAGAPRQAFFRLGGAILEVVQEPEAATARRGGGDHSAFFWGLAFVAPDLERTAASLGDRAGEIRDAVQPGRRIATLRRSAGLAVPVALMTPAPGGEHG